MEGLAVWRERPAQDQTCKVQELTYSCLEIYLTRIVWFLDTFEDIFGINHKFIKYLKESRALNFDQDQTCKVRKLTSSCLEISMARIIRIVDTFENIFGTNHKFMKYLKESCGLNFHQHSFFKYFLEFAFLREISPK